MAVGGGTGDHGAMFAPNTVGGRFYVRLGEGTKLQRVEKSAEILRAITACVEGAGKYSVRKCWVRANCRQGAAATGIANVTGGERPSHNPFNGGDGFGPSEVITPSDAFGNSLAATGFARFK